MRENKPHGQKLREDNEAPVGVRRHEGDMRRGSVRHFVEHVKGAERKTEQKSLR